MIVWTNKAHWHGRCSRIEAKVATAEQGIRRTLRPAPEGTIQSFTRSCRRAIRAQTDHTRSVGDPLRSGRIVERDHAILDVPEIGECGEGGAA